MSLGLPVYKVRVSSSGYGCEELSPCCWGLCTGLVFGLSAWGRNQNNLITGVHTGVHPVARDRQGTADSKQLGRVSTIYTIGICIYTSSPLSANTLPHHIIISQVATRAENPPALSCQSLRSLCVGSHNRRRVCSCDDSLGSDRVYSHRWSCPDRWQGTMCRCGEPGAHGSDSDLRNLHHSHGICWEKDCKATETAVNAMYAIEIHWGKIKCSGINPSTMSLQKFWYINYVYM